MIEHSASQQALEGVEKLVRLLKLTQIETQVFYGESQDLGFAQLFGGQVLGQSLMAAAQTVENDRIVHSFHGYFLRPGDPMEPIYYEVDLIRTGKSFSTRRVLAKQKGLAIYMAQYSFHKVEQGLDFSPKMPSVLGPESLESEEIVIARYRDLVPQRMADKLLSFRPIDVRVVEKIDHRNPQAREPIKNMWTKVKSPIPEDRLLSQAFLAYASDFGLSTASLIPHGLTYMSKGVQVASLDHTMWFHRSFQYSGWFLHALESINSHGNRGLNRGLIFDSHGQLVASVAQEGLIRASASAQQNKPRDSMDGLIT
jgi:acyl-CoA thioesterase-2